MVASANALRESQILQQGTQVGKADVRIRPSVENGLQQPLMPVHGLFFPPSVSQASDVPEATLFKNGREVCLGDIVGKGAVAKHDSGFAGWRERVMPVSDPGRQRLHIIAGDRFAETSEERTGTDRVHRFAGNSPGLNGNAKIETKFQQQPIEDVLLRAVVFDVVEAGKKSTL